MTKSIITKQKNFCQSSITKYQNATINTFDFLQKGQYFVCAGKTVEQVVSRCFLFITAEAKRIEAVFKAMLKLVFVKVAQAQT